VDGNFNPARVIRMAGLMLTVSSAAVHSLIAAALCDEHSTDLVRRVVRQRSRAQRQFVLRFIWNRLSRCARITAS
jgi:hypothetical protein